MCEQSHSHSPCTGDRTQGLMCATLHMSSPSPVALEDLKSSKEAAPYFSGERSSILLSSSVSLQPSLESQCKA